mgnify:CR=1 FL=1|jgi:hypothetical protein
MGTTRSLTNDELSEIRDLLAGVGKSLDRAAQEVEECRGRAHANMSRSGVPSNGGGAPLVDEVSSSPAEPEPSLDRRDP